jgi:hypothetical protein
MSDKEREEFIQLLKSIFDPSVVKEVNISENSFEKFRKWRIGEKKRYPSKWLPEEITILFHEGYKGNPANAGERIGRSPMAAFIKYGERIPKLLDYCERKDRNLLTENPLDVIRDFLKEEEEERKKRRERKKKLMKLQKIEEQISTLEERKKELEDKLPKDEELIDEEDYASILIKILKEIRKVEDKLEKLKVEKSKLQLELNS